jgi:dolichol-phosphate mannosyltransferase
MSDRSSRPAVSVVVPLFNEEENVGILQAELAAALRGIDHEIIFVDDGSSDRTLAGLTKSPEIRILSFEKNAGQSAAIYAGANAVRGDTVVLIDGDLQNDPADIPRLLMEIERGADLVCGYRAQRKDTLAKRLTSRIANFVRSRFTKDGVRDTGCTLKAMRRECVRALVPFKGMHRFIPALIKGAGYRLVEVPVNHRARRFGTSKYGLGNRALHATIDMFAVRWLLSRQLHYTIRTDNVPKQKSRSAPSTERDDEGGSDRKCRDF